MSAIPYPVVTDLTICIFSPASSSTSELDLRIWHRVEKELYLNASHQSVWLYVALANEEELTAEDLLVRKSGSATRLPNLGQVVHGRVDLAESGC